MAFSHCFFSSSFGACSVCEWPPSASTLDTLNTCLAVGIKRYKNRYSHRSLDAKFKTFSRFFFQNDNISFARIKVIK